ncbi:response regulator [Pantoea sp. FN0302]|uniref:response regulator n=1 Tax=unclassified Pantoea TaxID=2630326 RepID=UPI003CF62B61
MSRNKKRVLLAEDDTGIATIVEAYLRREGFDVIHAIDGEVAVKIAQQTLPDFVILDIKMPKKDGWHVLKEIRSFSNAPIMMLTALDADIDKVLALKTGADDYLVKPFSPVELVARVHVILKRMTYHSHSDELKVYRSQHLTINQATHQLWTNEGHKEISKLITYTEFRILLHLMRNPSRVFTRYELIEACFSDSDVSDRTVDSHISKLRKKLETVGISHVPEGIRGVGYRLGD